MGNLEINEYIQFMGFNSKNEKLYLMERNAPTPDEKEILKNLPFKQGVLDFSALLGSRVFENREIEYVFMLFNTPYNQRKIVERNIKQKLMVHPRNKLYDTHDSDYYWLGKCKSVEVENGEQFNQLTVTIIFDCYPYMISPTILMIFGMFLILMMMSPIIPRTLSKGHWIFHCLMLVLSLLNLKSQ